jgi:RsiW-degrading membrane proteinase PrsW (M82 family)
MHLLSLAVAVIVPALLLLAYGVIKTRRRVLRECLWAGFLAGVAVGVAVIAWELALGWLLPLDNLPPAADAAGHALLIAALPEEGLKFGATLLVIRRFVYPGDVPDVVLAALSVAVGFAVMEDAGYVISAAGETIGNGGLVALVRSVSAVPLHVVCGLAMGGLIGSAVWETHAAPGPSQWRLAMALLVPVLIHGGYDFLLMLRQREPDAAWTMQLLPLVIAVSTMAAIVLSNTALRAATHTEPYGSPRRAGAAAALGGFLLLIGLGLVAATLVAPGLLAQQALAVYCVVPLMFGLDLIWTALARSRVVA